ncbi:plasmid mobilization protein [Kitasatospora albolonga]|uniref:plasmid mobilization protein n=1 Tax=Kitasatospora albolonga TaxID=68173 RepID=UPI0031EE6984
MAKTRISISLDEEHAERIRQHAERAGMDVSAYLVNAATRQMAEVEAAEAQFAHIDSAIAAASAAADSLPPLPEVTAEDLTEEERREVEAAMALVYGTDPQAARPGHAA